ncbi:GGDEF domain-containing protein [Frigidibacter sp.]|uniref:GGDEF domain-containing protein n=1 Tax=Frigidibacter sp. TaxID=2586418 RepID=UPI002732CF03|nr:diguanylate cyclase [Frigidibacter sp.]MDP3340401.1 diguanylate cyclase [Frigidibacter sp.]
MTLHPPAAVPTGTSMSRPMRFFRRQSLRSWIALAMVCAVLPLLVSSAIGYAVYHQTVVQPFRDVLTRQHDLLISLERIQGDYWTITEAVNAYVLTGELAQRDAFEAARARVEAQFARIEVAVAPENAEQVAVARQEWTRASADAAEVLARPRESLGRSVTDLEQVLAVEREFPVAARQLEAVLDQMRIAGETNHAAALLAFQRLELGALGAILLSLGMMGIGAFIVNRAIVLSADELVAGAERFASGHHEIPVHITVPPELAAVAEAFNTMTRTIQQQREQLADHARRDGLTSLLNRREFDAALGARLGALTAGQPGFALLMGDVDHFKRINDTYGHVEGDRVLRRVAEVLVAEARADDLVFRYGGEEFALILNDAGPAAAAAVAERLRLAIAAAFEAECAEGGAGIAVTLSFGMAFCAAPAAPEALIRVADGALYEAKAGGRNRVVVRAG